MTVLRRFVPIAVIICGLIETMLVAQQPAPRRATGTDKAEVSAILVDVVVRDRRGQPVGDLAAGDFEIFEDGVKQEIGTVTLFSEPEAAGPAPERLRAAPQAPVLRTEPPPQPVIALVFDRLSPEARALAHKAALDYASRADGKATIGVFGIDLSLRMYQGYTQEAAKVRAAIDELGKRSTSQFNSSAGRSEANARAQGAANAMRSFEAATSVGGPAAAGAAQGAGGAAPAALFAAMEQRTLETFDALERDQQGYATTNGLLALVNSMRSVPGRKSIVLFSEGLALPPAVIAQFRSVIDSANRANVSIYTMDAVGLRTESTSKEARENINAAAQRTLQRNPTADVVGTAMTQALERNEDTLRLDPHSGLGELAGSTGGLFVGNTNDLAGGFRRMDEDMRNYYVLTYVPSNDVFDGRFRTIKVNVRRSGVDVASRKGYFAVRSPGGQPVKPFEGPALAMLDTTPVPNAFPVRAAAVKFPERERLTLVPVLVSVPAGSLTFEPVPDKQAYRAEFTVLVRFRDQSNEIVRKVSQNYQFDGPADRMDAVKRGDVLFYRQIDLAAGVYNMETVVFDAVSKRASVRFATFDQPEIPAEGVRVSNLVVVSRTERLPESDRPKDNPFVVGEHLLYPNLGEPLAKGSVKEMSFFFTVYALAGSSPTAVLELRQSGKLLAQSPLLLDPPDSRGRIQQVGRLPLDSLAPGTYDLRVIVTDSNKTSQSRSVPVRIVS